VLRDLLTPAPSDRRPRRSLAITTGLGAVLTLFIATCRRVRRLHRRLEQALYQASHDQLTGLPNREAALTHLFDSPVDLVGLLDLDDFKSVNDRFGHQVGDEFLIIIATRLENAIAGQGIAARLAGDEFLLIWTQPGPPPIQRATAVLEEVCAPLSIWGHALTPSASLGLTRPGPDVADPAWLIGEADEAMYEAKHIARQADRDDAVAGPRVRLYPALPAGSSRPAQWAAVHARSPTDG